jgi:hypothetical protein
VCAVEKVVGTGVELRVGPEAAAGGIAVEAQTFCEGEDDGGGFRMGGVVASSSGWVLPAGEDPTSALVAIAYEMREQHLGDLLGDMRMNDFDVTRFEFYAAPFRVELAESLREALAGSWKGRPPG